MRPRGRPGAAAFFTGARFTGALGAALITALLAACESLPPSASPSPSPAAADQAEGSTPITAGRADPSPSPSPSPEPDTLSARIERAMAFGSIESVALAARLVRENKVEASEHGRAVLYAADRLMALVYTRSQRGASELDPPRVNPIVRALDEVAQGRLADESIRSAGRLPALFSALVILRNPAESVRSAALAELDSLEVAGLSSLLIPLLRGRAAEAGGRLDLALARYREALGLDPGFYPAEFGLARALQGLGRYAEAIELWRPLSERFPADAEVLRALARCYYALGRYMAAAPVVQEILRANPTEDEFIIMRAHILIAGGAYSQASPLLDAYATRHPREPLYLYLRVLQTWKGRKARQEAIALSDSALVLYPEDTRIQRVRAEILLEGAPPGSSQRREAVAGLEAVLALNPRDTETLVLLCREAAEAGDGQRAFGFLEELLAADPGFADYSLMAKTASLAGRKDLALRWSEEWMAADPADDDAVAAYVRVLLDSGNAAEAMKRIDERLGGKSSARARAILLYCRSRLQTSPEAALSDLRASLTEDPANMDSLLAMVDILVTQKDYKKAAFYLRQAQSIEPSSPAVAARQATLAALTKQ